MERITKSFASKSAGNHLYRSDHIYLPSVRIGVSWHQFILSCYHALKSVLLFVVIATHFDICVSACGTLPPQLEKALAAKGNGSEDILEKLEDKDRVHIRTHTLA